MTKNILVLLPAIIFSSILYINNWFIVSMSRDVLNTDYTLLYNKPVYIFFAVYFILICLLSLYFLWVKYQHADGVIKKQLGFLLFSVSIGLAFGLYFDLIVCYFGHFQNAWLGPVFTLLMNMAVFYLIFFYKKQ